MKDIKTSYTGRFIFRTPLLPLNSKKMNDDDLFEISKQSFFREAIYLASPVLYDELDKWHRGETSDPKSIDKLKMSLAKYYSRMQSRCTPYGLFAACSVGNWGEANKIMISDSISRHTRLDMNYLCALAQYLCRHPALLPYLKFYPNNSLYTFGDSIRYIEYTYVNNKRSHQISSIENNLYIQKVVQHAALGATIKELAGSVVEDDITIEEAEHFIQELIQNQLLTSELEPSITGKEFIHQLLSTLKTIEAGHSSAEIKDIITVLFLINGKIKKIDQSTNNEIAEYRDIYTRLKELGVKMEENQLFQTDSYKDSEQATLGPEIQEQLTGAVHFLNKLSGKNENPVLKKFKENFYNQYEDAEIPLLEALDTETGVGYKGKDTSGINQLLDGLYPDGNRRNGVSINWNELQDFLHQRLSGAIQNNEYTVEFNDNDIKDFDNYTTAVPDSLSIMFRVINDKQLYLQDCGGSSGANLLGRFAHGDKAIEELIREITDHEQHLHADKIIAEIIHLPESRLGNILLRPVFREYEIPYLGKSSLPDNRQIQLQDIYISIRNNKIILRSKRLNKEIIPRLSTAHNFSHNALPVYHFLCDMQTQHYEKQVLDFSWGALSKGYTFLPRAIYKDVILQKATWQFRKKDFESLLKEKTNLPDAINAWRTKWNIPALMVLADGDNELFINFENEMSSRMFVSVIKKRNEIVLEEFLFDPDNLFVKDGNDQGYTNEFIAVLLKQPEQLAETAQHTITKPVERSGLMIKREFSIGSEWIYFKFYCGIKTADKLLCEALKPLTEEVTERNLSDKFFFIRFNDPDNHIRLRFHLTDVKKTGELIGLVHSYFSGYLEQGLITKIQTDTYKRELERYGTATIHIAESVFHIDSVITLRLLDLLDLEKGEQIKWQFAMKSVNDLLDGLQFTTNERLTLLEILKNSFVNEHGGSKELKVQLDTKFRNTRKEIEFIMNPDTAIQSELQTIVDLLNLKKQQLAPFLDVLSDLQKSNRLENNIHDLAGSYIHMMLNRIFRSRQRTYEMLIYDLLYKFYKSNIARNKKKGNALQIL